MCICINCDYVDRCAAYHAVEKQHQQPHLTETPDFQPSSPQIDVHLRTKADKVEMEWDVVGCNSFQLDEGKWIRLRPNDLVPT